VSRTYSSMALAGKRSRTAGVVGEALTKAELVRHGYQCIEQVHTPFKIIRGNHGEIKSAVPVEKVSGDFRAVWPVALEGCAKLGVSVLVESKARKGDRILWTDLEPHQRQALQEHVDAGGISLLSVVLEDRAVLMNWPVPGFGPGSSIRILGGVLRVGNPGTGSLGEEKKVALPTTKRA
jgi:hypothetical protein